MTIHSDIPTPRLDALPLDRAFLDALPADPLRDNRPRQVPRACYSFVQPRAFPQARLIAWSREMAEELGIPEAEVHSARFSQVFSGTRPLPAMEPYALNYGGHQFGHWAGQLGDGRAINLGEVRAPSGRHWLLQLKGAGRTPYSRQADGLAVLRSSVREFLCSEAMHHLGVPTTRALSLVASGEQVLRDMFYDGHPNLEPGAIVCRVAPSFLRFGSFQLHASRQELDLLRRLADYCIRHDFPELNAAPSGELDGALYGRWFHEICQRSAQLMVEWMRVGFVHGVMNTDNMSILGLTIDYGPYGWLEDYDPDWTPNTTDAEGRRYRFGQQPQIALWNLVQLANALYPLVGAVEPFEEALDAYRQRYEQGYLRMMTEKLGLTECRPQDEALVLELVKALQSCETDMTLFFRRLAQVDPAGLAQADTLPAPLLTAFYAEDIGERARGLFRTWLERWAQRLREDGRDASERRQAMDRVNPKYVLRNYLAQQAIDRAEAEDYGGIHELLDLLRRPYDEQPEREAYAAKRPEWARHRPGCSMLSCSS